MNPTYPKESEISKWKPAENAHANSRIPKLLWATGRVACEP